MENYSNGYEQNDLEKYEDAMEREIADNGDDD